MCLAQDVAAGSPCCLNGESPTCIPPDSQVSISFQTDNALIVWQGASGEVKLGEDDAAVEELVRNIAAVGAAKVTPPPPWVSPQNLLSLPCKADEWNVRGRLHAAQFTRRCHKSWAVSLVVHNRKGQLLENNATGVDKPVGCRSMV